MLQCSEYPPCAAGFRKKGPLMRHVRSEHLKLPPWACTHPDVNDSAKKCEAAYDTKGKLGNHVQMVHTGLAKKRYVCAVCTTWKAPAEEAGEQDNTTTTIASAEVTIKTEPSDGSLSPSFPIISASIPAPRDPAVLRAEGVGGFTTHSELRAHISEAHPPICATCGFVAKRSRDLKTHIREKHEQSVEERRVWMCEWEGCWQDFTQVCSVTVGGSFYPSPLSLYYKKASAGNCLTVRVK